MISGHFNLRKSAGNISTSAVISVYCNPRKSAGKYFYFSDDQRAFQSGKISGKIICQITGTL
jgi:hypothetical protein